MKTSKKFDEKKNTRSQTMNLDIHLYERIVEDWEQSETCNGIPYYINHKFERTSWDHPFLTKIMEELDDFFDIRYAAYRTAKKLRLLQRRLYMDQVDITSIQRVFEEQGLPAGTKQIIHPRYLLKILTVIYTAPKRSPRETEILALLLQNVLINLFDTNRTGCVKVMSIKVALVVLCAGRLTAKYKFFYQELHDPSTYISKNNLATFLQDLMQFPELLHESVAFGRNVEPAIASCCQMSQGESSLSEDVFYSWLQKEPRTIVWLPTMHRVAAAESVKHEAKCSICKGFPILGFRYRCLQCFSFDICENCFFTGKTIKKHKLTHPIQEYCIKARPKDDSIALVKTIKNNLCKKYRRKSRPKYLPIEADCQFTPVECRRVSIVSPEQDVHSAINDTARKLAELENLPITLSTVSPVRPDPMITTSKVVDHPLLNQENIATDCDVGVSSASYVSKDVQLQQQREELEVIIRQLEEENRALQLQLKSMKEISDTESNLSDDYYDNPRTQILQAKMDVVDDHNSRLTNYLSSVQNVMQESQKSGTIHCNARRPNCLQIPCQMPVDCSSHHSPSSNTSLSPYSHLESSPLYSSLPKGIKLKHSSNLDDYYISPSKDILKLSSIEDDCYGNSLDNNLDVSPSHFSLLSLSKSQYYPEEEVALQELVERMEKMFPADLSLTASNTSGGMSYMEDEMLQAASSIGAAMSQFVNHAINMY
ncbi:hypothetical protein CHS0354_037295 [Potamilus streckersoni]|uniref:Dystrophin n=1 Tax=Potamilus streckersoni TaxID=2493646 RepID=A0AAE0TKN2_9BIVA|nr:hypothetical protein CHS0354_037295 [Potamilus streckersoni]